MRYYLEIWYKEELVLSMCFGDNLESAVKNFNKLAGCMLAGQGGSIVVVKKTTNAQGFTDSEELLSI